MKNNIAHHKNQLLEKKYGFDFFIDHSIRRKENKKSMAILVLSISLWLPSAFITINGWIKDCQKSIQTYETNRINFMNKLNHINLNNNSELISIIKEAPPFEMLIFYQGMKLQQESYDRQFKKFAQQYPDEKTKQENDLAIYLMKYPFDKNRDMSLMFPLIEHKKNYDKQMLTLSSIYEHLVIKNNLTNKTFTDNELRFFLYTYQNFQTDKNRALDYNADRYIKYMNGTLKD